MGSILAVLWLALYPIAAAPVTGPNIYVSTAGSDATGNGSVLFPFATVQGAARAITASGINKNLSAELDIVVEPGTYPDTSAVIPSGSNGHQVVLLAQNGVNTVFLWGGHALAGCALFSGSTYRCPAPTTKFYAAWENGVRLVTARTPNLAVSALWPRAPGANFITTGVNGSYLSMTYNSGNISPGAWSTNEAQILMYPGGTWNWFGNLLRVATITTGTTTIAFPSQTQWPIFQSATGSRYWAQGMLSLLDAPGEFYDDAANGFLYVQSWSGGVPGQIVIPTTSRVVSVIGSTTTPAHDIGIKNIGIQFSDYAATDAYADWGISTDHPGFGSGHLCTAYTFEKWNSPNHAGGLYVGDATNVSVSQVDVEDTGFNGMDFFHTTNATVDKSLTNHTGADGITFEGDWPGEGDYSNNNAVTNTFAANPGDQWGSHSVGIRILSSHDNTLSNIETWGSVRDGVFTEGGGNASCAVNYTFNNHEDHIYIHDVGQDTGDMAGWGVFLLNSFTGGPYNVTFLSQSIIDHIVASPQMTDQPPYGVYTDNNTYGQNFSHVMVGTSAIGSGTQVNFKSGEHTVANCSFDASGNPVGGFDPSTLDRTNIGVPSSNPYSSKIAVSFLDNFESGLGNWITGLGTPALSTAQSHSPTHSFIQNQDGDVIYLVTDRLLRQKACAWYFDDPTNVTLDARFKVGEMPYSGGSFTTWNNTVMRGAGVLTTTSTTDYVYLDPTPRDSGIARTAGWHQFCADYSGRQGATISIDGTTVTSNLPGDMAFDIVAIGDFAADGLVGVNAFWDDVTIN